LNQRRLKLATLRTRAPRGDETPWQAARAFARRLAVEKPRTFDAPVYGSNNWCYAYGKINRAGVLADARCTAEWAGTTDNRPCMLIDDGWEVAHCDGRYNGGPWHACNRNFDDMGALAAEMRATGVRPGLWYRPLVSLEGAMEPFMIRNGLKPAYAENGFSLDPTIPEVAGRIADDARRIAGWGFEIIKHDFTTVDLLGTWANGQGAMARPARGWHFHDRTKTNAEIVRELYGLIHRSAGGAIILGCQTIGHLGVGTLDIQRVGGDVDGRGWERTRRMGINSLAFRLHQHGIFYQVDADCAPVTPTLPWEMARQWLDLLARSGTPLFVSADPAALNAETDAAIGAALRRAAKDQPPAEALDWMQTRAPREWRFGDETRTYRWMPDIGCPPPGLLSGDAARLIYGC
jgi:alpha-galactosidase